MTSAACQQEKHVTSEPLGAYPDSNAPADEFSSSANRPPSAHTLHSMSRILVSQHKDDQAEYILNRITKTYPEFLPAYCDLSELQMRQGRTDKAIESLNAGLKIAPSDAVLLNNLGMCRIVKGDYPAALASLDQACAAAPNVARYQANRGTAMGLMGRDAEAMAAFNKVLTPGEAHYNMAVLLETRKETARAQEEYRLAEKLGVKRPIAGVDPQGPPATP